MGDLVSDVSKSAASPGDADAERANAENSFFRFAPRRDDRRPSRPLPSLAAPVFVVAPAAPHALVFFGNANARAANDGGARCPGNPLSLAST